MENEVHCGAIGGMLAWEIKIFREKLHQSRFAYDRSHVI
jgi:hypothetical protein